MPKLRKLMPEEVRVLNTRPLGERARIAAEYDAYLQDFVPDDYGEVQLDGEDNRLTVRKRLLAAATRRDLALAFRRTSGPLLRFCVETATGTQSQEEPVPSTAVAELPQPDAAATSSQEHAPADAPKRRGRRPRAEILPVAPAEEKKPRRGRKPRAASA